MTLWTSKDAVAATTGRLTAEWSATGVSIDTRTIAPGDLFVALTAERDGHEFVAQALEKGAAAALVSRIPEGVTEDAPLLIVEDVQAALEALGAAARARMKGKVVAITGSVGKTSTKEMLRTVLKSQGRTHAAEASYNNHWGVPLTLARMPPESDFAVIEIGMNAPGEIGPLARLAQPDVAMITTVAAAHLEAFDSIEDIAREKADILTGLGKDGIAVLPADIETAPVLQARASRREVRQTGFGRMSRDWTLTHVRLADDKTIVQAEHDRQPILFKLNTAGSHFAMNGLGVLAVVEALGADVARAALDLALWAPPAGRGTRETIVVDAAQDGGSFALYDDAFNANPTSMAAALEVLASAQPRDGVGRIAKGRRIAVLGDMLELGLEAAELHAAIAADVSLGRIDQVHTAGSLMQTLHDALAPDQRGHHTDTAADLAERARSLVDAGDVVLVKGSKGSKISLVVDALRSLGRGG